MPGKSEPDLNKYLNQLQGKENVRVICMDLSPTYRNIAKTHFPNAKIVADRFHVIRLMHHHCMQTYRAIDQSIKHNRGILAVLRKKPDRLTDKQRQRRDEYLEKHPAIKHIYLFKQKLYQLLMHKSVTKEKAIQLIPQLLESIHELKTVPSNHSTHPVKHSSHGKTKSHACGDSQKIMASLEASIGR